MKITIYTGALVGTNGYLIESNEGNFLIDAPGGISEWLDELGVRIDALYLTHQHYDHVEDAADLQKKGVKIYAWAAYSKDLTLETFGEAWGLPRVVPYKVDELLPEGIVNLLGHEIHVSHIPGHSADSITFYFSQNGIVFAGDALFQGSVGRCDLPGGSFELLLSGIQKKLLCLPDETRVLSGHGRETSIGREKTSNGYLL